jgi:hypothetical protein
LILFIEQSSLAFAAYFMAKNGFSTHWLLNLDSILILFIVSLFYFKNNKKTILTILIFYSVFLIWFLMKINFFEYSSLLYFVTSVIVVLFTIIQLFVLVLDVSSTLKVSKRPIFYINCGFLFYFSLTLFTTLFESYFKGQGIQGYTFVVIIQFTAACLLNLFLFIGLWKTSLK